MDSMKQGEKRKDSNLVFWSALSHDAGYLISHTHRAHIEHMFDFMKTSPCKYYCIRVYGLYKANTAVISEHILWFI